MLKSRLHFLLASILHYMDRTDEAKHQYLTAIEKQRLVINHTPDKDRSEGYLRWIQESLSKLDREIRERAQTREKPDSELIPPGLSGNLPQVR